MTNTGVLSVLRDFRAARVKADTEAIFARLKGQSSELLSYDEVRHKLKGIETQKSIRKEIPLDAIVGSVGRQQDFTRAFLPKNDSHEQRWSRIKMLMNSQQGLPPIEVYELGEVYFVRDGNHRVSVAKDMGLKFLEAYVTPVSVSVPITADLNPDELIIKSEYTDFLGQTNIHKLRCDADLNVSIPGQFEMLLEHIQVHHYYMGLNEKRDVPYEEAVAHWYDEIYQPVITLIRERGLLQAFPERTLTDLYLWLSQYRADLETTLGWVLPSISIAQRLAEDLGEAPRSERVRDLSPETYLADDVLIAVPGTDAGWCALEQAFHLYRHEPRCIYGLHIVSTVAQLESEATGAIRAEFERRCEEAGVEAQFAVQMGNITQVICGRARWVDLVVANLAHPPAAGLRSSLGLRLSHSFASLLRRCPRPILAVPNQTTPMNRPLLAYNATEKANMALFAAAYMAKRWNVELDVLSVSERGASGVGYLGQARRYLENHGIEANYLHEKADVVETLLHTTKERQNDLIIMGSYEFSPLLEPFLGGVLDEVLRGSQLPLLICQ